MRQKAQTEHALSRKNIVNYAESLFSCMLTKKKFIGKGPRYIYVFKDRICIGKTPFVEVPERQLIINDESRVSWTYQGQQITSIQFHIGRESYQYYGSDSVLRELKKYVGLRIFQTKIQDEYRADSVLGRGSYATVLELINLINQQFGLSNREQYAAKCIDQKRIQEKKLGYKQLMQEINTMRLLQHDHILALKELYIGNQNYYMVMDMAQGGSLLTMMKKREQLFSNDDIRLIMRQLLEGIAFVHKFGIMHRDLKPENILFLTKYLDSLRIADFGLAQNTADYPYTYPKCGTPGFVAPEILQQDTELAKYDCKCDIFSIGVILYILFIGEPLFNTKDRKEQLEQNRVCDIILPDTIGVQQRSLLTHLLAKNPSERYTANEALRHPFFQEDDIDVDDEDRLQNMLMYKICNSRLQRRMPTFQKNPFVQKDVSQRFRNISFVQQTNLFIASSERLDLKHIHEFSSNF